MADQIPAIRVTDPQSRDTVPESIGANRTETFDYAAGSRSASPKEGRYLKGGGGDQTKPRADRMRLRQQAINIWRSPNSWETASFAVRHVIQPRRAGRK